MYPNFGCGYLFARPIGGNQAANPSPIYFATVQDISVDVDATIKELRGNLQFPDDTAVSDRSVKGEIAFGKLDVNIYNQLFFADSQVTGTTQVQPFFNGGVIPATPFQITPTIPGGCVFVHDLGVRNHANGSVFQRVTGTPNAGQYAVNEGTSVYTFSSADHVSGIVVDISFSYSSTAGQTLTVNNQLQGYSPTFEMWLDEPYALQGNGMLIASCKVGALSLPRKRDDYTIGKTKFEGFARADGVVLQFFQTSP